MRIHIHNILNLKTREDVIKYFMDPACFCNIKLPTYFDFGKVLEYSMEYVLKQRPNRLPHTDKCENINYSILVNKGVKDAYRELQIANPFKYCELVYEIASNWEYIKNRFALFSNSKCEVASIPPLKGNGRSVNKASIMSWHENILQKSIELSLEYKCVLSTDIANCYPSLYTHAISWSLHEKEEAKNNRKEEQLLGNRIDKLIEDMQNGQTNGIPQGSVLFDFIAEMVLGFADKLLFDQIGEIYDYHILRFRDDYKIFTKTVDDAEKISLALQQVLSKLNFHLNTSKTSISTDIITDAIKPDRIYYLTHPIGKVGDNRSFNAQLLGKLTYILKFSQLWPNSGSIFYLLDSIGEDLDDKEKTVLTFLPIWGDSGTTSIPNYNVTAAAAILTEIALLNPRAYDVSIMLLSKVLELDNDGKCTALVVKKLSSVPNVGHLMVWLQRLLIAKKCKLNMDYNELLCRIVNGGSARRLWNMDWLEKKVVDNIPWKTIINKDIIKKVKKIPVIKRKEISSGMY